jgi:dihydrofolate reductase
MRKVIAGTFVSLDGVMQAPGGRDEDPTGGFRFGGWTAPHWDDALSKAMERTLAPPYDLLLGRKTYEIFAAYWPFQDDPIGKAFTGATKYVATRTLKDLTWKNSIAIRDAASDVARLKQQDGPPIQISGSSNLIQTLLRNDLIDEFNLLIFPVVFGKGKRLFGEGTIPAGLSLSDATASTTGVTIGTYRRAGPVKTGSFAADQPSKEELARREKMKREG